MSSIFEADVWVPTTSEDLELAGALFQEFGVVLPARTLEAWEMAMRITKHNKSYIVELSDCTAWRIWPADMADTLQWLPETELDVRKIDHETCSHALINESDGSQVRVINANRKWLVSPTLTRLLSKRHKRKAPTRKRDQQFAR